MAFSLEAEGFRGVAEEISKLAKKHRKLLIAPEERYYEIKEGKGSVSRGDKGKGLEVL